jgi:predicted transcriptional regulator
MKILRDTDGMGQDVELSSLDLRYEGYRMKNPGLEEKLLTSMSTRGIEAPLEGVEVKATHVLLNGFKRYRCARKLHLKTAPYASLGSDEVVGILSLLRVSHHRALGIVEQAAFIDELHQVRQLSVAEIAQQLSRSKSWVSMRLGLMEEMSAKIRTELLSGAFPVYSYMYQVRPFMRMNGATLQEIERFVTALSGQQLSLREIEQLAHGYFRGPEAFRQQILQGHVALALKHLRQAPAHPEGYSEFERVLLNDLEITQKYVQRVMGKSQDERLKNRAFFAQANLLTAGLLSQAKAFFQTMRQLHDRSGQA